MSNIIINPNQDPNYQLFKYSGLASQTISPDVRIGIEDLVRTGFQDKYNELAQSTIFNIYSQFTNGTSGQQTLVFETTKGSFEIAIVGAGVVQGVGIITADSVIYNATVGSNTFTNVQQALDYLLYTPPTISAISGGWATSYYEVGVNPINSNASVTATRQVDNINIVNLALTSANAGALTSASNTPSPPSQSAVTTSLLSTQMTTLINPLITVPDTFTLTGSAFDVFVPANNGASITSSKTAQLVYPMIYGSSTYDSFTNSISNVQTQFNSVFMPTSTTITPSNPISLPLFRDIRPKPVNITVSHSNAAFTYFMFPQSYYGGSLATLLATFKIQDSNTNLTYPYDTDASPDVTTEWRVRMFTLNNGSLWNSIPYFLVTSKVAKPALSLKYIF